MSKSILLSIKPKYVADILNGKKTIEIRKTCPKCDLPIDVYIYCTNDIKQGRENFYFEEFNRLGRVCAKFILRKVEKIFYSRSTDTMICGLMEDKELCDKSCLSRSELVDYLKCYYEAGSYFDKNGYAYHIEDLVIFDKPKELNNFMPIKWGKCGIKDKNGLYQCHKCPYGEVLPYGGECHYKPLKRPPQSYCFVESEE